MARVNVYLTFNGNCEEVFNYYAKVFSKELSHVSRFGEMPKGQDGIPVPESEKNLIMHVSLPLSNETVIMGSDAGGEWAKSYKPGNNFSISITAESKEEADRLFNDLSKDGQVFMPMKKTFWDSYFGMLMDKFGINWMVSFGEAM